MDFEHAVQKKEEFGAFEDDGKTPIHIAFGVDCNFVRPMGVAMTSLVENNKDLNLTFHIFANSIYETDVDRLRRFADAPNAVLRLYCIDSGVFEKFHTTWNYSAATYNRFLVAKLLYPALDRVLYIDADIICKGNLAELIGMDFEGNIAMVVHDQGKFVEGHMKTLNLKRGRYFNAGMMYIDLKAWNEADISERSIEILQKRKFFLLDQDALNIFLDGRAKFIDHRYNEICNMEKSYSKITKNAVLVHFASRNKPWHVWCVHPERKLFLDYAEKSLWADVPLLNQPRSYKEMKMMGKAMLRRGKYADAVKWYLKYWKARKAEKK